MAAEQVDTVVGAHVELKGSLRNHGSIHIHGRVTGDITSDAMVMVGETAVVTGPIIAKVVEVSGQVHGSISAEETIELHPKSLVKGDLATARLSIKPGATFVGKSQMAVPNDKKNAKQEEDMMDDDASSAAQAASDRKKPRLEIE